MDVIEIRQFLLEKLNGFNFERVEFQFSIQPGMTAYKLFGYSSLNPEGKSLKPRPPENIEQQLLKLHQETATDEQSKWNILKVNLEDNKLGLEFIWDEIWQAEIDQINKSHKLKNPDYELPLWDWQIRKNEN